MSGLLLLTYVFPYQLMMILSKSAELRFWGSRNAFLLLWNIL